MGRNRGGKRRSSIFLSLLLFMVFASIFPLVFSSYKLITYNSNILKRDRQLIHLQLCKSMAGEISTYLSYCIGILTPIEKAVKLDVLNSEKIKTLLESVYNSFRINLRYIEIIRPSKKERIIAGVLSKDISLRDMINSFQANCLNSRKSIYISRPIYDREFPDGILIVGKKIVDRNGERACLMALLSLRKISYSFKRASMAGNVVYLVDIDEGRIIWHPDRSVLKKEWDISRSPIYDEMLRLDPFVIDTFEVNSGSNGKLVSIYRIPDNNVHWGIVVETPQSIANADIDNMTQQTIKFVILSLLMAIVLSLIFSVMIAKPIAGLAKWANLLTKYLYKLSSTIDEEELKEIESNYPAKLDIKSNNEIGLLAERFQELADTLKEKVRQLHQAAQENRELFKGSITTLAAAIDAKDPYTRGHSERVNDYSKKIAMELGLSQDELDDIENAALLHDIGKIGITDEILKKPGDLTDEEFKEMKKHPEYGARIIEKIPKLKPAVAGVRYHHERLDGSGYPYGLKGDEIPFSARIIAVADAFDAMTTERPYQKPFTPEAALNRLKFLTAKGKFDIKVVNALIRAYNKKLIHIPDQNEVKKSKYMNFDLGGDV